MSDQARIFSILKELSEACGVSGFEEEVRQLIREKMEEFSDEVSVDKLGNVIAKIKGKDEGFKVMLAAHMDEIGLMVKHIEKNGFLRFVPVGGVNPVMLVGQRVLVITRKGKIRGIVGTRPPHLLTPEEAKKAPEIKNLFIDIGAKSKEEAEKMGVRIGDVVTLERDLVRLGNGSIVTGKAFDDRIGVAIMIEAMRALSEERPLATTYAVATVQEEVGCRGAQVSAFKIHPSMAIVLDITAANDVAGVEERDYIVRLGAGPAIKVMDVISGSFLGLIAHPKVKDLLIKTAEEEGIPYQLEILVGGSTDAATIHLVREGIPSGVVSIPTRYAHSPTEVLSLNDAVNAVRLVTKAIRRVRPEDLSYQ